MRILLYIIISTFLISIASFIAAIFLAFKEEKLKKIILILVSFSTGALIGGAFLHLLPESIQKLGNNLNVYIPLLIGFSIFYLLEQFIHWHHCHKTPSEHNQEEPFTYLILLSETVHNFIDGVLIGAAFVVDIRIGLVTWFVIAAHELPQKLGDFGVLIHGGWKKTKALMFNFFSSLAIIIGGVLAYFLSSKINIVYLIPFAAGTFIYIGASDLIPEIKNHNSLKKNLTHFIFFVLGILFIAFFKSLDIE
jgi:zinc and cadmium transporter